MKNTTVMVLSLLAIGVIQFVHAEIHTIDDITLISKYIRDKDTLVCFDIDETLLYPSEPEARDAWFGEQVTQLTKKGMSPAEAVHETVTRQLVSHRKTDVCQADWDQDELIDMLRKKGLQVICLTARSISFAEITYRQLKQVLVHVEQQTGQWNRCYTLTNLKNPAHYIPGVIFSAGNDKGLALEQFLNKINYTPKHIIMVDDVRKHIEALERMTKRLAIPYDGFVITHEHRKRLPCVTVRNGVYNQENNAIKRASN